MKNIITKSKWNWISSLAILCCLVVNPLAITNSHALFGSSNAAVKADDTKATKKHKKTKAEKKAEKAEKKAAKAKKSEKAEKKAASKKTADKKDSGQGVLSRFFGKKDKQKQVTSSKGSSTQKADYKERCDFKGHCSGHGGLMANAKVSADCSTTCQDGTPTKGKLK